LNVLKTPLDQNMYAFKFKGRRFDIGNTLEFITTNFHYGLKDEKIQENLRQWASENN